LKNPLHFQSETQPSNLHNHHYEWHLKLLKGYKSQGN